MKYMGSKLTMLAGTLGPLLLKEVAASNRFVDLFAGSGSVSHYISSLSNASVVSVDQMKFATVLSLGGTGSNSLPEVEKFYSHWLERYDALRSHYDAGNARGISVSRSLLDVVDVESMRRQAAEGAGHFIIRHYGGFYFSLNQATDLAAFYESLPTDDSTRTWALAALIRTASRCSASPGHTAQPFRPTPKLLPHIRGAWSRSVGKILKEELKYLANVKPRNVGSAVQADATEFVGRHVQSGDLLFCDPPYSEAQYSRFYHVLEGIARGGWAHVSGAGRAPAAVERTASGFSSRRLALESMSHLLESSADKRCVVVMTYPEGDRSNNLSSSQIIELASRRFIVEMTRVPFIHSTLGGSSGGVSARSARNAVQELILIMRPK